MKTSSNFGIIRPHTDKLIASFKLLDSMVIGITLWSILSLNQIDWTNRHTWWLLISIVCFTVFADLNDLYYKNRGTSIFWEVKKILISWAGVILIFDGIYMANKEIMSVYDEIFWVWSAVVPLEILFWHLIVSSCASILRKMGRNTRRAAILGSTSLGVELQKIFQEDQSMGIRFVGFYDDRQKTSLHRGMVENNKIEGNIRQLIERSKSGSIDMIYITLASNGGQRLKTIIDQLSDTTVSVYFVPNLFTFDLLNSRFFHIRGVPIITINDASFYGIDGFIKRIFDILLSSIVLTIMIIPAILIMLAIKSTSPGPAIFKQRRYGFRGEEIMVWKFRTMMVSDDADKVEQAKKNDPRVTRLGAFLRRTSMDELPQFINVLQGRMSIVGPRPHAIAHNELYRGQIKGYMLRHKVKPGITGLAQVNGFRGETKTLDTMEGRIKYDLAYIKNWSLWLDMKIVLMTIVKSFGDAKAY